MTPEQERIAAVLADARDEALSERPLGCAALNSVIDRLAKMWTDDNPGFDAEAFRMAANYRGLAYGPISLPVLP